MLLGLVMGMILQQVLHSVFLREACPDIPPCPACPACQPLPTGLLKAARSECPACPRCPDPAPACPECDPQSCPACPEAPACPDAPPCEAPGAPAAGAAPEAAKPRHLLPLIHSCSWNKVLHKKVVSNAVVVEVGAYDGTGTVEFAKLAKKVYSFEPTPDKVWGRAGGLWRGRLGRGLVGGGPAGLSEGRVSSMCALPVLSASHDGQKSPPPFTPCAPVGEVTPQVEILGPQSRRWGGVPHRRYGGVHLDARDQRRRQWPSPVRTRHGAVEQGQSGGSVGTTSQGKGRGSRGG